MRMTPAVKVILFANIAFYILTYWITPLFPLNGHSNWFENFNVLYPLGSEGFGVYQYITYMFIHGGWWHLFFNMWSLMIFGNSVEMQMGTKRFVYYYLICGVGSAFVYQLLILAGILPPSGLEGASGALYGVMAAAAFFFPNAKLFVIPIPFPIKLKYLVAIFFVIEMYYGITSLDNVAHFAHLGGVVVGVIVLLIWRSMDKRRSYGRQRDEWTTSTSYGGSYEKEEGVWTKVKRFFVGKRQPKMRVTNVREANYQDHAYNERKRRESAEIDRILDKIRTSGYQNLTDSEKAALFDASKRMQEER